MQINFTLFDKGNRFYRDTRKSSDRLVLRVYNFISRLLLRAAILLEECHRRPRSVENNSAPRELMSLSSRRQTESDGRRATAAE